MEKVKVSKDLFEGLQRIEKEGGNYFELLVAGVVKGEKYVSKGNAVFNDLTPEEILKIYKYGYELEETQEEKLLKYYKELGFMFNSSGTKVYVGLTKEQDAIFETLSILGIEIKGINA